ncbi:MAG: GNAT family N-acetyltransferase [Pseudonocardiaceae bacterium]
MEVAGDENNLSVRLARLSDAESIRAIYNPEVTGSTITFDMVERTLAEQQAWIIDHSGVYPAIVVTSNDTGRAEQDVLAFGSLNPYRNRPAYSTTVENSVYVRSDCRGQGLGRIVVTELIRLASSHGFHSVIARVVGGHEASIGLHRSCGFELVGLEREVGRKFRQWLDVAVLQRML